MTYRVYRGGGWTLRPRYAKVAHRSKCAAAVDYTLGLRVARSPEQRMGRWK